MLLFGSCTNASISILLISFITKTLSFITVACYHNMWNRKLHDEMFYGVILFRYCSRSVFSRPRKKKKKKSRLIYGINVYVQFRRSHEFSPHISWRWHSHRSFHLFRLYLHKSCWKAEIVTNSETLRFPSVSDQKILI